MRMWMIPAKYLCIKHLCGEHNEIHKFRHSFEKGYNIKGRMIPEVQIEPFVMYSRHNELAYEINKRAKERGTGYGHRSPYFPISSISKNYKQYANYRVDKDKSYQDLINRCPECRKRMKELKYEEKRI